jgi:hypothetical protein
VYSVETKESPPETATPKRKRRVRQAEVRPVTLREQIIAWIQEEPNRIHWSGAYIQSELARKGIQATPKYINNLKKELKPT